MSRSTGGLSKPIRMSKMAKTIQKPYELTVEEMYESCAKVMLPIFDGKKTKQRWPAESAVAHKAQKKLLEYLNDNHYLRHTDFIHIMGDEPCSLCRLLKDFGINGAELGAK